MPQRAGMVWNAKTVGSAVCAAAVVLAGFVGSATAGGEEVATSAVPKAAAASAPEMATELLAALTALKGHLEGRQALDAKQIEAQKRTIDTQAEGFGRDGATIKAAFDLVAAYEKSNGPLWVSGRAFDRGKGGKTPPPNDIHWTVYTVMQRIMDRVYTPENLARHGALLDGFVFGCSARFPGAVPPSARTAAVYTVKVDASYRMPFTHEVLGEELPARRPTGAYAPPGAIVTVAVPASLVGKGYAIRVGAHSWDHSNKPRALRLDRVSLVYPVAGTDTQVANPLGGGIYLEVPLGADVGVVELAIRQAVRSPFFAATAYHKTTPEEWRGVERDAPAPWADFQTGKFLMQVPASWIRKLDDPAALMADWDKAMDAVTDLMGLPNVWGREVAYLQVDLQNRGSAFFPGYPTCNDRYDPASDYGGYAEHYLVRGPQRAPDYVFHEMGHGFQFAKYAGDREAAVNLLHVAVLNRKFGVDLETAFRSSRGQSNEFCTLDTTAVAWMMTQHFVDNEPMAPYERQYQLTGHAKFVDIVRLFGWEALDKFWRSIVSDEEEGKAWDRESSDTDKYTLRLAQSAGMDLRPLVHFWGIPTLNDSASDAAVKAAGLPASPKIYDLLLRYEGLVPKDRETFRSFALSWWGKPPRPEGFTIERNHASRWDSYDEKDAERVRRRVHAVLDRYFPNGRPEAAGAK